MNLFRSSTSEDVAPQKKPTAAKSLAPTPKPRQDRAPKKTVPPERNAPPTDASGLHFDDLNLDADIRRAIKDEGYTTPTPIQSAAIPYVLDGRDLIGCAQTGTGKTAAFALPILNRLLNHNDRGIKALVLSPTRELALQIADSFKTYGRYTKLKTAVVFGGVGVEPQRRALRAGPDILVATPGRFLDLKQQGCIRLDSLEVFVLDEADRMLDMGFIHDVKKIIGMLPNPRQNLLFSATMPTAIKDLSMRFLKNPASVAVTPVSSTSELVDQHVYHVDRMNKRHLLIHLLENDNISKAIVFTRTKAIANRVSEFLCKSGITAEAIHGNKSQSARQRALENFRVGQTRILVASDLAARGIDVEGISHVINYDVPNIAETYVHRIGRTGRAQAAGIALSFCEIEEQPFINGIERLTGMKIPVVTDHPFPRTGERSPEGSGQQSRGGRGGSQGRSSGSRQGQRGRGQSGGGSGRGR